MNLKNIYISSTFLSLCPHYQAEFQYIEKGLLKSLGVKVLCVLHVHDNVTFTFIISDMEILGTKCFILKGFELGTTLTLYSHLSATHLVGYLLPHSQGALLE